MGTNGVCELCNQPAVLRASHVVPRFVFKWLKETSPGHLRGTRDPDRRVQDGPKKDWLCDSCEQRFSDWERPFASSIFLPVHAASVNLKPLPYRAWALKFATSISWRTLRFYRGDNLEHFTAADVQASERAELAWRDVLMGRREHPGEFEQHVILVDTLKDPGGLRSPFINRYFLRTVHSDLIASESMCITYTKLCRVIVIGHMRMDHRRKWRGTKLHVNRGLIGGNCTIPDLLIRYWDDKANQAAAAIAGLSPKQKAKIDQVFEDADHDELRASETFRAMRADVELSGADAFKATGRARKTSEPR